MRETKIVEKLPTGNERILFVDDEKSITNLVGIGWNDRDIRLRLKTIPSKPRNYSVPTPISLIR
jgi:hypothetical protein